MQDAADLVVVVQLAAAREVGVEGVGGGLQHLGLHVGVPVSAFIRAASPASVSSTRKCGLSRCICRTRRWLPSSVSFRNSGELAVADARVVLGPGDGELLGRDAPVQQVPGPGPGWAATRWHSQWVSKPVTSGSGPMRGRGGPATAPTCRGWRTGRGPRSAGRGGETGRVVPHLAGMGDLPAQARRAMVQAAIRKGVRAVEHGAGMGRSGGQWARTCSWLPLMPPMASTTTGALRRTLGAGGLVHRRGAAQLPAGGPAP
jgi:hypothetical protein